MSKKGRVKVIIMQPVRQDYESILNYNYNNMILCTNNLICISTITSAWPAIFSNDNNIYIHSLISVNNEFDARTIWVLVNKESIKCHVMLLILLYTIPDKGLNLSELQSPRASGSPF